MDAPSMVQRTGDTFIVRSVVSGNQLFVDDVPTGGGSGHKPSSFVRDNNSADVSEDEDSNDLVINEDGDGQNEAASANSYQQNILNLQRTWLNQIRGNVPNLDAKEHDLKMLNEAALLMQSQLLQNNNNNSLMPNKNNEDTKDGGSDNLPQCKIKRNYTCPNCSYFTQNPRLFLTHLKEDHGEKLLIHECKLCVYASRHYQKLVRHMKMVHGQTVEQDGSHLAIRKRANNHSNHNNSVSLMKKAKNGDEISNSKQLLALMGALEEAGTAAAAVSCSNSSGSSEQTFASLDSATAQNLIAMGMMMTASTSPSTKKKIAIDRHMKNHGGNGPFKCAACNFTADIKQSLTVHEMNHHVPAVGAASGMQPLGGQQRRRNKVGATDSVDNQESIDQKAAQLLNLASSMNLPEILQAAAVAGLLNDQKNDASQKKAPRPIPNLIPIQGQPPTSTPSNSALNLSSRGGDKSKTGSNTDLSANEDGDDNSNPSSHNNISIFKKKNESFFDKLKEKLVTNSANGSDNLVCPCNHVSKCLSELIIHQNNCQKFKQTLANSKIPSLSPTNLTINKNSTRCQFCRHRCKSSADLIAHMQRCSQATNSLTGIQLDSADSMSEMGNSDKLDDDNEDMDHDKSEPHPMENRIFVWNTMPEQSSQDSERTSPQDQFPAVNIKLERRSEEPEPILSGLPDQFKSASMSDFMDTPIKKSDHPPNTTLKKVFKCPHCSFWASTASRFHVHIVGHLNKKPFECSLCSYRSNWRWDITKHIRLKTIRDPSHKTARVLMNDETGRRNYTKYNKYISLMKVSDEDGNLKLMKSGEMTPNQEASLTSPHNTNIPRLQSSNNNSSNSNNANFLLMQSLKHFTDGASLSQNIQDLSVRSSLSDSNIDIEPIISNTTGIPHLLIQAENQMSTPETSILLGKLNSSDMNGENKKQTCYKCKKCQFKHPNRNVVLEHVNEHYRDAGVLAKAATSTPINSLPIEITPLFNNSGSNMNHNAANLLLPRGPAALSGILPAGFLPSLTNVTASAGGHYNTNLNIVTNSGNNNSANPGQHHNSNTNGGKHNSIANKTSGEHGEMDEASSGGTSGPPGWRSAAPYRCGHCHQVSNWKHVIQRHCRLKHNGNIKIELIGKEGRSAANKANTSNSAKANKNQAFHQPLQVAPAPPLNNPVTAASSTSFLLSPSQVQNNPSDNQQNNTAEMMEVRQKFNSIINQFGQDPDKAKEDNANKKKNYQCGYCPYLTDNKSQFSYHKSLHKADRMEDLRCKYCNYTATKKHLLEQHMKIHQQKTNSDDVIVVESENHSVFPKATVQESSSSEGGDVQDLMIMQIDEDGQDNPVPLNHKENKENMVRIPEKRNRSSNEFFCPHCPFKDGSSDVVNDHKKFHSIITNKRLQYNCEFCDFTSNIEQLVKDHRKLHFAPLKDLHKVEFCTTYDKLKLFVTATTASMAAASSHSTSQDQKIYDEDEVDEETSWINQFRQKSTNGTSSNSSKNVISSSGNNKVLVNSIGPSRGSLKRNHTSNNETSA